MQWRQQRIKNPWKSLNVSFYKKEMESKTVAENIGRSRPQRSRRWTSTTYTIALRKRSEEITPE